MSDHLIAEANRHAMALPSTHPTHTEIAWYVREVVELRAEVERLTKQIKDDNRSYGCELRDPNGTIWEQAAKDYARVKRAEDEVERLKGALELGQENCESIYNDMREERTKLHARAERAEADKARLDWLESPAGFDWQWNSAHSVIVRRAAIDAAMKP